MRPTPTRPRPLLKAAAAVALVTLSAGLGCDSPTEAGEERYALQTINGLPLPGPVPDPQGCCDFLHVTRGELVLEPGGSLRLILRVACRPDLPPETTCVVTDEVVESRGTYSREDGWIELEEAAARYTTDFTPERVSVDVGLPPSQGLFRRFLLVFGR